LGGGNIGGTLSCYQDCTFDQTNCQKSHEAAAPPAAEPLGTTAALASLFSWMFPENYEHTSRTKQISEGFMELFHNKLTIILLGQEEQLSSGSFGEYFVKIDQQIVRIADLLKTTTLGFDLCFTDEQVQRALTHDLEENSAWWWAGYWHLLLSAVEGFLGDTPYYLADPVQNWNILEFLNIFVKDYCGNIDV